MINFDISMQILVDHVVAADQRDYLSNPVIIRELVENLPWLMWLDCDWVAYKSHFQTPNPDPFGNFMSELVNEASEVTFELPVSGSSSRFI